MSTRRGLFGGVAALAVAPAIAPPTAASPPHLDAHLLRLGAMLTNAWAIENEAWVKACGENDDDGPNTVEANARTDATSEIVGRIEHLHALTLEGLRVKLRAVSWCRCGEPMTVKTFDRSETPATESRLLAGLIADLSAMGGGA